MSTMSKQQAYDAYQRAPTEGTKQALHNVNALSNDFVNFVANFEPSDPDAVDMAPVANVNFAKQEFYRTLLSSDFHLFWSSLYPNARGPGNTVLVRIRRNDAGQFVIQHVALTETIEEIVLEAPQFQVNSNSVLFDEGLVKVIFRATSRTVGATSAQVWNYQLLVNGRLRYNVFLVPFALTDEAN